MLTSLKVEIKVKKHIARMAAIIQLKDYKQNFLNNSQYGLLNSTKSQCEIIEIATSNCRVLIENL